jgi:hypothetical protein
MSHTPRPQTLFIESLNDPKNTLPAPATGNVSSDPPSPSVDPQKIKRLTQAWLSAAQPHLQELRGPHAVKYRQTVMMVLFSQEFNVPQNWDRPDVLARSTWSKHKDKPKLRRIMEAIREELAQVQEETAVSAVVEAVMEMQYAAPRMARRLIDLAEKSENDWVQLQAAQSVLDRADKATARKENSDGLEIPGFETLLDKIYGNDDSAPN